LRVFCCLVVFAKSVTVATNKLREKQVEAYLRKKVREHGGLPYKFTSPGRNGVPDRVLVLPCFDPHVQFVEVKAEGKEPTSAQAREHVRIREAGGVVHVVDCYDDIDLLFELCCTDAAHAQ
jgi:hypothetical protein